MDKEEKEYPFLTKTENIRAWKVFGIPRKKPKIREIPKKKRKN